MSPSSSQSSSSTHLSSLAGSSHTRSRTSSRATSPSRSTLPPTLRTVASFSTLRSIKAISRPTSPAPSGLTASAVPPHLSLPSSSASPVHSSASSVVNLSFEGNADGILVKDSDMEAQMGDGDEGTAVGHVEGVADDDARRNLREQLRRTLTQRRESSIDTVHAGQEEHFTSDNKGKGKETVLMDELDANTPDPVEPRQYFVLTDAGKPVFASSPLANDSDALASTAGLMQALISVFIDDGDKLRYIDAGKTRISFVMRSPLYYVGVSSWGEPEGVIRSHLDYLHLQILSVVSGATLKRVFSRRSNFDLRRLLSGAENFMHLMLTRLQTDLAISTSSLQCLPLDPVLRRKVGEALVPPSKMKDILYVMMVSRGRVLTIIRPKKRSVHPADLHILLNTIHAPAIFDAAAAAPTSWLPICLPRFNADGFLHAYVQFIRHGDMVVEEPSKGEVGREDMEDQLNAMGSFKEIANDTAVIPEHAALASGTSQPVSTVPSPSASATSSAPSTPSARSVTVAEPIVLPPPASTLDTSHLRGRIGTALVCVSGGGGGEFESIRAWCEGIVEKLETSGTLPAIHASIRRRAPTASNRGDGYSGFAGDYSVSALGILGLRHFVYKSRALVQITCPTWGVDYANAAARRRVTTLYQMVHDAIHAKSGQGSKEALKLQYIKTEKECVMGWITQPFELYVSVSPELPKASVVDTANAVARWVKREEARLFLRDAPVF